MKILLINNCHYRRGGADVVYYNTAKLLEKKGEDVIFELPTGGGSDSIKASNVKFKQMLTIKK